MNNTSPSETTHSEGSVLPSDQLDISTLPLLKVEENSLARMLIEGRATIHQFHRQGAFGEQVASALTDLCDRIVTGAFEQALAKWSPDDQERICRELTVVAVGGYGRSDMSPFSDVDLLFLRSPNSGSAVRDFISELIRNLWDIGLVISQSVRTPEECIAFAREELTACTAWTETRLVSGSQTLFDEFAQSIRRAITAISPKQFIQSAINERSKEYHDYYSATACLLEPNVKKSPGALRDIQLIRWVGAIRYGNDSLHLLQQYGWLTARDLEDLLQSKELLHRIRNELHFHANTAQDVLTLDEQIRLTDWMKFQDSGNLRGVEQFMQHYYRHTTAVHRLATRFVERARPASIFQRLKERLLVRRVDDHLIWRGGFITPDPDSIDTVLQTSADVLNLFELCRVHDARATHELLERARETSQSCPIDPQARRQFIRLLNNPLGLGQLIRNLHEAGLLSRLLPAFEHARCLIQFNQYHKYTVDEHSIRALEAATRRIDDAGPLGQAYRKIKRKDVLHLALLLHDTGKGLGEDHSDVGRILATDAAEQFELTEHDRDLLLFLVHKHLLMAHTAFRRDANDPATILQFTRAVATPEALRMLYVLTAVDTEAVAPGSLTAWKESLLNELFARGMEELTGQAPVADEAARAQDIREQVTVALAKQFPTDWLQTQLQTMPLSYLITTEPPKMAVHLRVIEQFGGIPVRVTNQFDRATGISSYTIFTNEGVTTGIFHRIAGALAASGFQIIGAQIVTRSDGVVIDTFTGMDLDYAGEPPPSRAQEVADRIQQVLLGKLAVEPLFAGRSYPAPRALKNAPPGQTQVEIDNQSSDRYTIVEVFADDRQGLLYVITKTLFELGLSVYSAKISTRLDQVVDAFYVTTAEGEKLIDEERLATIRKQLVQNIDAFEART